MEVQTTSLSYDGNGYIYYKGIEIEHYTAVEHNSIQEMIDDPKLGGKLLKRCHHIESLKLQPGPKSIAFTWSWYEATKQPYDPFLFFAENYAEMYIKENLIAFAINGNTFEHIQLRIFNIETCKHYDINVTTKDPMYHCYHYLESKGYKKLNAGQRKDLGGIYATKSQWIQTCNNLTIPYFILDTKDAFWKFACSSMQAGFEIEIPEYMYDHFLGTVPPLRMKYPHNRNLYFINSEPIDFNEDGKSIFYAFTQKKGRFYGTTIVPDKQILQTCK